MSNIEPHEEMRKLTPVSPADVRVNYAGFVFRELFIRLPRGVIADDLKEPSLWSRVQGSNNSALRKFDRVFLVSFDESWIAESVVDGATDTGASLAKPRITLLKQRTEQLFGDGTYQVEFNGRGYHVVRLRDGQSMSDTLANAALAERALTSLYPRRAG
jgi:hypothetical protein